MKKTGFLFDERYLLHETGPCHPETPARLKAVYQGIKDAGLIPKLTPIKASLPDLKWIRAVHDKEYIERFEKACLSGDSTFDCPDNRMCPETYKTALLVAGGILDTANRIMNSEIINAFCAVRPPGHHAEINKAMGFCYFNNAAITARYLQKEWGIKRVGITDFDVHHGNGTQHIFEDDPDVFYYSIHQHPSFAYPGTGREFEKGEGAGLGFTKNSPVLPGKGDGEYKQFIEKDLCSAFESFKPEVIIVSCGFDGHIDDDMSDIKLSTEFFSWIIKRLLKLADKYSNKRLISILEGGYSIKRLPELAKNHVDILINHR